MTQTQTTTHRSEQIEAIAAQIADAQIVLGAFDFDVDAKNAEGWTIEMRYSDHEYVSDSDYTQTSDIHLSDAELAEAVKLADSFSA